MNVLKASLSVPSIKFPPARFWYVSKLKVFFPKKVTATERRMYSLGHVIRWAKHEWLMKYLEVCQKFSCVLLEQNYSCCVVLYGSFT